MSNQPRTNALDKVNCLLFSFSASEINVARLIGNHWRKMYVCHEIDRGEVAGWTFITVWDPEQTISKIQRQPSFKTSSLTQHHYELGEIGAQLNAPLTRWELEMLNNMVTAAIEGRLNRFLLLDEGVMNDVLGSYLTQSWTCNSTAIALAEKLQLLQHFAGMSDGHSSYQTALTAVERTKGVERV
ncbi:hypothetical protein [Marinomonas piezotolerans]|nr:hypothetical protein [Marinomonas piezotolerans]